MRFVVRLQGPNGKYATFRLEADNRDEAFATATMIVIDKGLEDVFGVDINTMKVEELLHQA